MDRAVNPYSPGAGVRPPALVGRTKQIEDADVALRRHLAGRHAKGMMLTGLRGVGKTVLLAEFGRRAAALGYLHEHLEADEHAKLSAAMGTLLRKVLLRLNAKHLRSSYVREALGVLKGFTIYWNPLPGLVIDGPPISGPADSGDLAVDVCGLLCEVGKAAQAHRTGVFLTIDEIQYLERGDFGALVLGLHRAAQLSLPVMIAGAGLPSLLALAGEAKSYAERMFDFPSIGSLAVPEAGEAIAAPAAKEGVQWEDPAIQMVVERTQGHPYFLQEFAKQAWDAAPGPVHIRLSDVKASLETTMAELDAGFFRVRFDRTTDAERAYLRAMASLGPGPFATSAVAKVLGRTTNQVGPVRDGLIKRGLCYAPRWGQIAFTQIPARPVDAPGFSRGTGARLPSLFACSERAILWT